MFMHGHVNFLEPCHGAQSKKTHRWFTMNTDTTDQCVSLHYYHKNSKHWDRHWETVQTQIRLLPKQQSDLGLHYLPFHLYLFDAVLHCKTKFRFYNNYFLSPSLFIPYLSGNKSVLWNFAIIRVLSFPNNPKDLDPFYKMDLDFGDCFGRKKTVF